MWGLRPFGALLKRYTGKIFLKSRFGHPTAKVGLRKTNPIPSSRPKSRTPIFERISDPPRPTRYTRYASRDTRLIPPPHPKIPRIRSKITVSGAYPAQFSQPKKRHHRTASTSKKGDGGATVPEKKAWHKAKVHCAWWDNEQGRAPLKWPHRVLFDVYQNCPVGR